MTTHGLKLLAPLFRTSLIISLSIGAVSGVVLASSSYLGQYNAAYGTAATCSLCHTSPPTLNATGNTFLNSGYNLASIAPPGKSTASSPATSPAPAAPSSPAQTTSSANPRAPTNPQPTTSSNPSPSSGSGNNGATGPTSSGTTPTPTGTVQNNPAQGFFSEKTSSSNIAEKDETGSIRPTIDKSMSESSKKEDAMRSGESKQPSVRSPSPPRAEGNRVPKPNIQFRPPTRIRR